MCATIYTQIDTEIQRWSQENQGLPPEQSKKNFEALWNRIGQALFQQYLLHRLLHQNDHYSSNGSS